MPTKKQRRRQEKLRRHEYVWEDEEGNELTPEEVAALQGRIAAATGEVAPSTETKPATAAARPGTRAAKQAKQPRGRGRAGREVPPPSWRRVGKRALWLAPAMFILLTLLNRGKTELTVTARIVETLIMLAIFLPFSFVLDSLAYRAYRKRIGDPLPRQRRR